MKTVHILHWVGGITGVTVLALGLFIWISGMSPTTLQIVHALFGLIFVLCLLTIGIIAVLNKETRLRGAICIVYAPLVPILGATQMTLLVGDLHWIIRATHLLVGLIALVLFGMTGMRYTSLKKSDLKAAKQPQLAR